MCMHTSSPVQILPMTKSNFQSRLQPHCLWITSPFLCPLALFSLLWIQAYSISPARPIYLIQSLSRNWNFYWDEGDNSCKCANWRLAAGCDVKPSKGIKKSRVWNAAHSHVMYRAAPLGHSRLADCGGWLSLRLCCRVQSRTCPIINEHLSTQDTICSPVVTL